MMHALHLLVAVVEDDIIPRSPNFVQHQAEGKSPLLDAHVPEIPTKPRGPSHISEKRRNNITFEVEQQGCDC